MLKLVIPKLGEEGGFVSLFGRKVSGNELKLVILRFGGGKLMVRCKKKARLTVRP